MINLLYKDIRIPLVKEMDFTKGSGKGSTIQYLTAWRLVGNSEVHGNEIWSCGEYSATDGKYHIYVSSNGKVFDIALTEPLCKVNNVADSIEFINGVATVTRNIASTKWGNLRVTYQGDGTYKRFSTSTISSTILKPANESQRILICMSADFTQNLDAMKADAVDLTDLCMVVSPSGIIYIRDTSSDSANVFLGKYGTHELIYKLKTPTTETIQVPQIQEAESYSCVISQGAKAVEWTSFTPNPT